MRRQDLGEADRLLTLYAQNHGKIRAVAKGARRPRSRKAGHLEPFTRVHLLLARGRELDIITQAEALDTFPHLRDDLLRIGHAAYVVELLDRFTVEEGETPGLYRLVVNALERLNLGADTGVVLRYYELRLLELLGYRPELFLCLGCGEEIQPEEQFFSAAVGGVLCPSCGATRKDAHRVSLGALKVLRHLQRNTFAAVAGLSIRPEVQGELETLMEGYLTYLLERRLNAPAYVRSIRFLTGGPRDVGQAET